MFTSYDVIAYEHDGELICSDCRNMEEDDDYAYIPMNSDSLFASAGEDMLFCSMCGAVIWYDALGTFEGIQ